MKKQFIVITVLVVLTLLIGIYPVQASGKSHFTLPEYSKLTLANGITLYLLEQHEVPLIYITTVFKTGAMWDCKKSGLASLTADGLMFGTDNYSRKQIEETFDFIGAGISTSAGTEATTIEMALAAKDLNTILPIWKEMIVSPSFEKNEFDKQKSLLLMELEQERESPNAVIGTYFNKFVFADHVYGNPVRGIRSAVSALSADDLTDFYNTFYSPTAMAVIVAGDFKSVDMEKTVREMFETWQPKRSEIEIEYGQAPRLTSSRVLLVNKEDSRQTTFMIGGPGIKRSNPDYIPVQVINTILGGRFTSWLNDELRVNAGLTYGAVSRFSPYKTAGTFYIRTFTGTETTIQAVDLALETYNRLFTKGIDETTLESAKNYMNGQFPPRYETAGDLAGLLAEMYVYDFDESYINDFQNQVKGLTVPQANDIIRKYFPKENLQYVLIGKASDIRDQVSKYGPVTAKEITDDEF